MAKIEQDTRILHKFKKNRIQIQGNLININAQRLSDKTFYFFVKAKFVCAYLYRYCKKSQYKVLVHYLPRPFKFWKILKTCDASNGKQ